MPRVLDHYLQTAYAAMPGADVPRVGSDLARLAAQLAANGVTAAAVAVQQALIDVLAAFTPPPDQALEAAIMLAEARTGLVLLAQPTIYGLIALFPSADIKVMTG